jgi:hypothetical protein
MEDKQKNKAGRPKKEINLKQLGTCAGSMATGKMKINMLDNIKKDQRITFFSWLNLI